jgi:hypothetical protein
MLHPPLSPAAQLALQVLYGARNGALYGCRVRLPHSLLLTALWHRGSLRQKASIVTRATATHAARLCTFAALYKSGECTKSAPPTMGPLSASEASTAGPRLRLLCRSLPPSFLLARILIHVRSADREAGRSSHPSGCARWGAVRRRGLQRAFWSERSSGNVPLQPRRDWSGALLGPS